MMVVCAECTVGRHENCLETAFLDDDGEAVACTCRGDNHFDRIERMKSVDA